MKPIPEALRASPIQPYPFLAMHVAHSAMDH